MTQFWPLLSPDLITSASRCLTDHWPTCTASLPIIQTKWRSIVTWGERAAWVRVRLSGTFSRMWNFHIRQPSKTAKNTEKSCYKYENWPKRRNWNLIFSLPTHFYAQQTTYTLIMRPSKHRRTIIDVGHSASFRVEFGGDHGLRLAGCENFTSARRSKVS